MWGQPPSGCGGADALVRPVERSSPAGCPISRVFCEKWERGRGVFNRQSKIVNRKFTSSPPGAPSLSRSLRQGGDFDFASGLPHRSRFSKGGNYAGCPISRVFCEKWERGRGVFNRQSKIVNRKFTSSPPVAPPLSRSLRQGGDFDFASGMPHRSRFSKGGNYAGCPISRVFCEKWGFKLILPT